jgi:DNA-binding SARP family transcriptional activator/basic membrane lipoprotein Med (substrate-binding protein (PBP1-ABC) superfamily)
VLPCEPPLDNGASVERSPRRSLGEASTALLASSRAWLATAATTEPDPLQLRTLGPLEAEADGRVELGGRKQRAVLGALLLRAGEVVTDARLIDDVWGDGPPASAAHTLEAYVSRLRRELGPHGIALERHPGGYRLRLGPAVLDAQVFEARVDEASRALSTSDHALAAAAAAEALEMWHGPVLAGIPLYGDARAAADRLEEVRSRVLEIGVDADLALGHHAEIVGELRRAVEDSPYRQELVARLMVALFRSGRHVEALEVYERTRRALDADLGLQPSEELQRLAGQIVRQEPELRAPAPIGPATASPATTSAPRRRWALVVAAGLVVTAAVVIGLVVATDTGVTGSDATRVALIRMWNPGGPGGDDEAGWRPFVDGLLSAERKHGVETEIVDLFSRRPARGGYEQGSPEDVARLSERLAASDFDLVLWPLGLTGPNFFVVVPENPDTRFVFMDYCCIDGSLRASGNATSITLGGDQAAHLAGYLSGLVEARRPIPPGARHTIGVLVAEPGFPQEHDWERGFTQGARRALPDVNLIVAYTYEYDDPRVCERMANRLIDDGARILLVSAGDCGLGAIAAAGIRGVWAVGTSEDRSHLGPHVLASATKRYDHLTELGVTWYLEDRLSGEEDLELGLADDAVALVGIHPDVPPEIRSKVAREAARLRAQETRES